MRHRTLQVATWILSRLVPQGERESLVGDLMEEYALRAKAESPSAAFKWYLRQVCASVVPLLWARLKRSAWVSTAGVALLAYVAVGVADFMVKQAIWSTPAAGTAAQVPLVIIITFAAMVLIGYFAARYRRRAAIVLGVMLLLTTAVMMLSANMSMPLWYRIAYFAMGPAVSLIVSALHSHRREEG